MRNVRIIARSTIQESVRKRSIQITLALSLIFILAIGAMAEHLLKPGDEGTFVRSFQIEGTIRTLSFFGALLTLFITMNAIPAELERRTIYTLLARPLERWQFILGKYLGCLALLGANMGLMAAVAFAILVRHNPAVAGGLTRSFVILFVSLMSLCSLVVLLTTVLPATGGAFIALGIYLTGKIPGSFKLIAESDGVNILIRLAARALYPIVLIITPRVNKLNFEAPILESPDQVQAVVHVLGYATVCILLAVAIFSRKEL